MSGILANSSSKTMIAGDTAVDQTTSGFVELDEISLSTTGTPTSYAWGIAKPAASTDRAVLSSRTDASPVFTPDVEGYYTVTCVVNGTTVYILRIAVARVGTVSTLSVLRFTPLTDASVPTPATGRSVYFSIDAGAMVEKRPDGTVHTIDVT
jgi:hypothetical protein